MYIATSWWVALLCLLAGALVVRRHVGTQRSPSFLHVEGWADSWRIERSGCVDAACLEHVWHGPFWTTLKFRQITSGEVLYLTLWRATVSSMGWRLLRQLVSRGVKPLSPRTETP